jgi:hypothetical protein
VKEPSARHRPAPEDRALIALLPVLERLCAIVDAENEELARRASVDYQGHSQRKNQGLLELARMKASLASSRANPAISGALGNLSTKLDLNRRLLGAQLRAARTVASIVARAIRDGQSDGTYSAYPWRDDAR